MFPDDVPSVERGGKGGDFNGTFGLLTLEERPVGRGGRLGLGVLREGSGGGTKLNEDAELVESDRKWLGSEAEYGWGTVSVSNDGVSEREEGVVERESVERRGGGGGPFFPGGGGGGFLDNFRGRSSTSVFDLAVFSLTPKSSALFRSDRLETLGGRALVFGVFPTDGAPTPRSELKELRFTDVRATEKLGVDGVLRGVAELGVSKSSSPSVPDPTLSDDEEWTFEKKCCLLANDSAEGSGEVGWEGEETTLLRGA